MKRHLEILTAAVVASLVALPAPSRGESDSTRTYSQPVLLTSAGRAADVLILKGLSLRAGLKVRYSPDATADSLSDAATLVLVAGGSSKGLGAAKVNVKTEAARIKALVKAARKRDVPVIAFHIGGDARRGVLSDPFNKLAAESAELLVVVRSGDADGFFEKIAAENKAGYISVTNQADLTAILTQLFKPGGEPD